VWALRAITGRSAGDYSINPSNIASAWNAGQLIVICTNSPSSQYIVGNHCYAVVGYNPSSNMPFQVYNPWGTNSSGWALGTYNGHQVYGLFTAGGGFISQNFAFQSIGNGDANVPSHRHAEDFLLIGSPEGSPGQAKNAQELADLVFALEPHTLR
jgi:hypothetical protein